MEKTVPTLLPVLRSQQQGEILALIFSGAELSPTDVAEMTEIPYASVHREIERAERAGIVTSRYVGRTRLVSANPDSPYLPELGTVLVRAFGPPHVLAAELRGIHGIERAVLFGSWAAHATGDPTDRPVADIDLLVLGSPDRADLYAALALAEQRLGRRVQAVVRDAEWWASGSGAFHDNVVAGPIVELDLTRTVPSPDDRSGVSRH